MSLLLPLLVCIDQFVDLFSVVVFLLLQFLVGLGYLVQLIFQLTHLQQIRIFEISLLFLLLEGFYLLGQSSVDFDVLFNVLERLFQLLVLRAHLLFVFRAVRLQMGNALLVVFDLVFQRLDHLTRV